MRKVLTLISLSAVLFSTGCSHHGEGEGEEQFDYTITSPLKKDTITIREYVCQIRAIQHIELRALERGYLEKIYVDEGQVVRQGQKMFQIMPLVYSAEFQKAEAEANYAEIEYKNTKALADSNVVSPNELALAKAKMNKANAEVSLAKVRLGFTDIRAPFTGIMDRFYARQGSLLDDGDLLTVISDNSKMWVYFNVPEAEYLNYKMALKGDSIMNVQLLMANQQLFPYPGKVETIEADFNNETGNIAFRATFPNPKALLRHGETGNVQMIVPYKNALIIPQKATFEVLEKKYVFVVDKDNIVHQKEVNIVGEMPDLYVIKNGGGIGPEDKIMLEGIRKVRDNDKIEKLTYQDPKTVISHLKVYVE